LPSRDDGCETERIAVGDEHAGPLPCRREAREAEREASARSGMEPRSFRIEEHGRGHLDFDVGVAHGIVRPYVLAEPLPPAHEESQPIACPSIGENVVDVR
jgi:hypothetical protein